MFTKICLVVFATISCLVIASCTPAITSASTIPFSLNNTSWILANLNNQSATPDSMISINFAQNNISGSDGCNRYRASYTQNADKLMLTVNKNLISSMMACPEPLMQQASAYISALTDTVSYKIDGQQLILFNASGKTLANFTKQREELAGTSWRVTSSNNGKQAVVSTILGLKLTSVFSTDGRLSGSAGCNSYTASYEVFEKSIKINSIASTRKMCVKPDGIMEQEAQFLKALATVSTYQFDGKKLELRTADGALAVMLVSANKDSN
jgi:heat shock protein HslJ